MIFFEGFADELIKVARGAKVSFGPDGRPIFKPAFVPGKVGKIPSAKGGTETSGGKASAAPKKKFGEVFRRGSYGGIGSLGSKKGLAREGVFMGGK